MRTVIIGIAGNARHGKDTFAYALANELNKHEHVYSERIAFATALKEDCETFARWDGNKHPDVFVTWLDNKPYHVYLDEASAIQMAKELSGSYSKMIGGRTILQGFGVFGRHVGGEDYWVDQVFDWIDKNEAPAFLNEKGAKIKVFVPIITDTRFINEVRQIKGREGTTIKIVRPGGPFIDPEAAAHSSEAEANTEDFMEYIDIVVDNDSTEEDLVAHSAAIVHELYVV